MKQSQTATAPNGIGAFNLFECSNTPLVKIPRLIILQPQIQDETSGIITPAQSMNVIDVKALYEFLKNYYGTL